MSLTPEQNIEVKPSRNKTVFKEIDVEIIIYAQKILELLKKWEEWAFTFIEVLSRIPEVKDIEAFIQGLENKDEFDFLVFEKVIAFLSEHPNFWYKVNINLSPATLQMPLFKERFIAVVSKYKNVKLNIIHFELTENGSFSEEQLNNVNDNIIFLKSVWIDIWIDDYPNSNNNNELLWRVKWINFVKIDRQPILDYLDKKISSIELIWIINWYIKDIERILWKNKVKIVIEWVENENIYNLIKYYFNDRITLYQWYYFSKPQKIEDVK